MDHDAAPHFLRDEKGQKFYIFRVRAWGSAGARDLASPGFL